MPRLPDTEVESYLRRAGLSSSEVDEVMTLYGLATPTGGDWSREESLNFLDAEIEARGRRAPASSTAAPGGTAPSAPPSTPTVADRPIESVEKAQATVEAGRTAASVTGQVLREASSVYGPGPITDAGPLDGGAVAQALAEGEDPMAIWDEIKGRTFNLGSLGFPGVAERQQKGYRPVRRAFTGTEPGTSGTTSVGGKVGRTLAKGPRRFLSPTQALAILGSMNEDYLTHVQQQMLDAGLYQAAAEQMGTDPIPTWGVADPATRRAFMALFVEASLTPEVSVDRVLNRLIDERSLRKGVSGGGGGGSEIEPFTPTNIISAETAGQLVDDMARDLLGRFATDEEKETITQRLQQHQIAEQRQTYQAAVTGAQGVGGSEVDAFMEAIASTESGGRSDPYGATNEDTGAHGRWQVMPANWPVWAAEAGLGRNAPQTPENQRIVVRYKMLDYYRQFGSWRDVAVAWFAGPGAVGKADADRRSDGNITVAEYAQRAVDRMADYRGGVPTGTPGENPPIFAFDPQAETEAALKAADPAGWAGSQWADRAIEFYNLLGGLV